VGQATRRGTGQEKKKNDEKRLKTLL